MKQLLIFGSVILGITIASGAQAALEQDQTKIGVVGAAKQNLSAIDQQEMKRTLVTGDDVIFEETITTDKVGRSQLIFMDKSTLTIGPNSSVVIDKFVFDPGNLNRRPHHERHQRRVPLCWGGIEQEKSCDI